MSWRASQWAVAQHTGSAAAKAILLALAEDVQPQKECDGIVGSLLGQDEIGRIAEVKRRTVLTHLKALEDAGLITRRRRVDEHGYRTSDLIILNTEAGAPSASNAHGPADLRANDDASKVQMTTPSSASDAQPLDTDLTDEEPMEESPLPPKGADGAGSFGSPRAKRRRDNPGARIPEDWAPTDADRAKGADLGFEGSAFDRIAEEFRNFWLATPGAKARKLDWSLTFQNRLIAKVEQRGDRKPQDGAPSAGQAAKWIGKGFQ